MNIFFQEEDRVEHLGKKSNRSPWALNQNSKVSPVFSLIKLSKWLMLIMPIVAFFLCNIFVWLHAHHSLEQ